MKKYTLEMSWMEGSIQTTVEVGITPGGAPWTYDVEEAKRALSYRRSHYTKGGMTFRVVEWTPQVVEL